MDNLSFHLTDITGNSVRAGASDILIYIEEKQNKITMHIADNGCGMNAETVAHVTDPFYTTRTTRRVGLGLPFLKQNADQTGGFMSIKSEVGKGTDIEAVFIASHIDCPPWGDLPGTIAMLITGNPDVNIRFIYEAGDVSFAISTEAIKEVMDGIPVSHPKVMLLVKDMIAGNIGK